MGSADAQVIAAPAAFPYAAGYGAYAAAPLAAATYAAAPLAAATYAAAPIATATYAAAPAVATAPVAYAAAPIAAAPSVASSQFQAQDEFGNVAYGYQNINSAKQESGPTRLCC